MWNTWLSNCILYIWKKCLWCINKLTKKLSNFHCHFISSLHPKILQTQDILKHYALYLKWNSNSKAFTISVHYLYFFRVGEDTSSILLARNQGNSYTSAKVILVNSYIHYFPDKNLCIKKHFSFWMKINWVEVILVCWG